MHIAIKENWCRAVNFRDLVARLVEFLVPFFFLSEKASEFMSH